MNVGVALHSPSSDFISVRCRDTYGRLSNAFHGIDGASFRASMKNIEDWFAEASKRNAEEFDLSRNSDVMSFAYMALPKDDSALQWSKLGSGLTKDPEATLDQLYERMVVQYDHKQHSEKRSDAQVWSHFSGELKSRQLLQHFQRKTISVLDDEVSFEHAVKNGIWHCFEPISFDLSSPESIKNKAHRWLGQMTSVQNRSEEFKVYFLLGEPQDQHLMDEYQKAISILSKAPIEKEVFLESQVEALSDQVESTLRSVLS